MSKEPALKRILLALAVLCLFATPAFAVPGKDPSWVPSTFKILPMQKQSGVFVYFDTLTFTRFTPGWDFGDRQAYACTFVEYFDASGELLFLLTFERVDLPPQPNGSPYVLINDKGGVEISDEPQLDTGIRWFPNGELCGSPDHASAVFDGSDHMPHYTTQNSSTAPIRFYRNGVQIASLDLRRDQCRKGYWTPGDEPGEAWLWWDEDAPEDDGFNNLPCAGGGLEPVAVARLTVDRLAPGVTVCVDDAMEVTRCTDTGRIV